MFSQLSKRLLLVDSIILTFIMQSYGEDGGWKIERKFSSAGHLGPGSWPITTDY